MYRLDYTKQAQEDIARLRRDEPAAHKKLVKLLGELMEHPRTGTGKPELLSGDLSGVWSRRINQEHRILYEIHDKVLLVLVLSMKYHYKK